MKSIRLWGVRQNNLKSISVDIPLGSFTVICGPSGSGKSSLAFETLYAEGQRRYIESLSNYSKQFLNKAPKPDIEGIENIPPAISLEQKNTVKSSRSTVGTTTEVIDYLRLLYEKAGEAFCPFHHVRLERDSVTSAAKKVLSVFPGERGYVLALIPESGRSLEGKKLLAQLLKDGFSRIVLPVRPAEKAGKKSKKGKASAPAQTPVVDTPKGVPYSQEALGEIIELRDLVNKGLPKGDFYLVVDRSAFSESDQDRLADSVAQAYKASTTYNKASTASAVVITTEGKKLLLSEDLSCSVCGYKIPPITSALFSFNSPIGACSECNGFGNILTLDEAKVVPNPELSLAQGAIAPFAMPSAVQDRRFLSRFCKKQKIDMHTPWKQLSPKERKQIWDGGDDFYGVKGLFEYLETKKYKMHVRVFLSRYKSPFQCPSCHGGRLKPEASQVLLGGQPITELSKFTTENLFHFIRNLKLGPQASEVCAEPLRQLLSRLSYLRAVGVTYLTMDRLTKTLSGGEYQRLLLANQLGTALSQTLYVLDEPTVGLHPRDNDRLISVLKQLRELGNTLVVVEHDYDVIKSSTHVIEMGPGSGHLGGQVLFSGPINKFYDFEGSNTVEYLKPSPHWQPPRESRPVEIDQYKYCLELKGCRGNNLKNVDIKIPLHRLVTVTGVSGSGKSSLISHTLYPALARELGVEFEQALPYQKLNGANFVKNVVMIDQSPIGKVARSTPVTYLKVYDLIRGLMAATPEAKALGFTAGTYSLNVDGGRCPVCKGLGFETVDMLFMDDIAIKCEACDGKRFRPEALQVTYKGKNMDEILNMTVSEAMDFFVAHPNIRKPLLLLKDVGLDYIRLGQSARSLSGGESQRLKIARELYQTEHKATLYIMDEPTTGLHFREVHLLLKVLNKLIEGGGSVLLIEHNLEVIKNSDYIIDVGPEAGEFGGEIVAQGSPDEVIKMSERSYTGRYLKAYREDFAVPQLTKSPTPESNRSTQVNS